MRASDVIFDPKEHVELDELFQRELVEESQVHHIHYLVTEK